MGQGDRIKASKIQRAMTEMIRRKEQYHYVMAINPNYYYTGYQPDRGGIPGSKPTPPPTRLVRDGAKIR